MASDLLLELVAEGAASPVELGVIAGDNVAIGRDPGVGDGITVPAGSVSRHHGTFFRCRTSWLYRDNGGTNGSWINGVPVPPNTGRVVRAGDTLQLADVAVLVHRAPSREGSPSGNFGAGNLGAGVRSVIVFSRGTFFDEFPVPQFGRAVTVGGANCDLTLDADFHELPALVIEGRGPTASIVLPAPRLAIKINDVVIDSNAPGVLHDRDGVSISNYTLYFNDPTGGVSAEKLAVSQGATKPSLRDWTAPPAAGIGGVGQPDDSTQRIPSGRTVKRMPFGQGEPEQFDADDPTMVFEENDPRRYAGQARRTPGFEEYDESAGGVEDRVIIFIGVALMVAVVVLLVWWLFL